MHRLLLPVCMKSWAFEEACQTLADLSTCHCSAHPAISPIAATWRGATLAVQRLMLPFGMKSCERREHMMVMEAAITCSHQHVNVVRMHTYMLQPSRCGYSMLHSAVRTPYELCSNAV